MSSIFVPLEPSLYSLVIHPVTNHLTSCPERWFRRHACPAPPDASYGPLSSFSDSAAW